MSYLTIQSDHFRDTLVAQYPEAHAQLSLTDLITVYSQTLLTRSDVMTLESLDQVICKQLKCFCDYDALTRDNAQIILGVKSVTENVILAIEQKDNENLQKAYDELKAYQKRIQELEKEAFNDELTGSYNRRYLLTQILNEEGNFMSRGVLFTLTIEEFNAINKRYSHVIGDSVLKFFSRSIHETIHQNDHPLIRFGGAQFVLPTTHTYAPIIERKLKALQGTISSKKFKTSEDDILKFEFSFSHQAYTSDDSFQVIFDQLINAVE